MKNFQSSFLSAILHNKFDQGFLAQIEPVGRLTAEESVRVYQNDYYARMMEALGQNYEATWVLLGDESFLKIGTKYIQQHNSSLRNLSSYGDLFDDFLNEEGMEVEVVQMARFEKAFWDFFHRKPSLMLNVTNIEEAVFKCDYFLSHSEIRLFELWKQRENPPESLDEYLDNEYLCIFKKGSKVEVLKVSEIQYQILLQMKVIGSLSGVIAEIERQALQPEENDWKVALEICLWTN